METNKPNQLINRESWSERNFIFSYLNWLPDSVNEIIFWKHPIAVIALFLMIKYFSLISLIVSIGFVFIVLSFILRLYSSFIKKESENPLKQYLEDVLEFVSIQITDKTSTLNKVIKNLSAIFLFNDYTNSLKFFFVSLGIYYIGMYCNLIDTVLGAIAFLLIAPRIFCALKSLIRKGTRDDNVERLEIPKETLLNIGEKEMNSCETNINDANQATANSSPSKESKMINILLLGETGVGKSTWINGFVNYLTYESLKEARAGAQVSVIPATFTVTDSGFQEHTITYGISNDSQKDEKQIAGQSATQMPKTYIFDAQNVKIQIIDTPGIGDTEGIDKDKENMQNIMSHLSHYEELNGIIVLLKPNNSRLNVMFEFCIKELLTHLHKDACKNIVICFTNARGTFYRPGDTMRALKALLEKSELTDIKLTKETVYCMDNEPVRLLMAMNTITFDENEIKEYETSWEKAVDESKRLVNHVDSLSPHLIQNTLSINEVRRCIIEQSRPMAEITEAIEISISEIEDKKKEEISENDSRKNLHKKLQIPTVDLQITKIDKPRTVCSSPSCVKVISIGNNGIQKNHFETICHDECQITTDTDIINCPALQGCWAMQESVDRCRVCSCPWYKHMHITYDTEKTIVMVENESIKKLINEKNGAIKAIMKYREELDDKLDKLKKAKKRLAEINAHFACFLKQNAIAAYNDALLDYVDHLIEVEKKKASSRTLGGLSSLRRVYQEEIQTIEKSMNTKTVQNIELKKINDMMLELQELPIVGEMLLKAMSQTKEAKDKAIRLSENVIKLPRKSIINKWFGKIKNAVIG